MKKNIFKRMIVSILALSLVFSFSGPISAASHAPNGSDVLPDSFTWDSFSVRQDLVSGDDNDCSGWEIDLVKAMDEALKGEFGKYYTNRIKDHILSTKISKIKTVFFISMPSMSSINKVPFIKRNLSTESIKHQFI